jgi:uncharacterized protein (TIGR02001 family)
MRAHFRHQTPWHGCCSEKHVDFDHMRGIAMKKTLLFTCLAGILAAPVAFAQTAAPAPAAEPAKPEPEFTFTGNAGLFSDYRFRGYTQTAYKPAFQGGFDLAHKSGFYIGNWNSNVEQSLYTGASLEMDFYGGYKGSVGNFGYDVGYYYYYYPNSGAGGTTKIDNGELYVGGSYGPVSAKYYYSTTNFFALQGNGKDSKGSQYLDIAANFDLGNGFGVNGHVGWQKVAHYKDIVPTASDDHYYDYKLGVTKDISGWVLGATLVATSKKEFFMTGTTNEGAGKTSVVVSVTKTF